MNSDAIKSSESPDNEDVVTGLKEVSPAVAYVPVQEAGAAASRRHGKGME